MTTLHDRLADLADEATGAPPSVGLWDRGRRLHRRRRAWRKIADRPEPYVRQVLVRESISRWRARRWRERSVATAPDRPSAPVGSEDRLALQRALLALPPRQRAVIVLRYYDDLTEKQTAQQLGIAVGTVKSQTRDGLARLRELVPDLDDATYVAP